MPSCISDEEARRSVDYRGSEEQLHDQRFRGFDGPATDETEAGHVIASTETFIKYSYKRRMRSGHRRRASQRQGRES